MKILIVGAGASGLVLAIKLKMNRPELDVLVLEKNNKVGKKLLITGNGKCNMGNSDFSNPFLYRNKTLTEWVFKTYGFNAQQEFFNKLGVKTKMMGNLSYPYSESARTFVDYLYLVALKYNVKFLFEEELIDYSGSNNIVVKTNKNTYYVDKLVLSTGGKTYQKVGGSEVTFNLLAKHNYKMSSLHPGLCPVAVKEKVKSLAGVRVKANVKLFINNAEVYEENGEVLFKDDGLSGIVIFNIASLVARNYLNEKNIKIVLDLFKNPSKDELFKEFKAHNTDINLMRGYFVNSVSDYILKNINLSLDHNTFKDSEIMSLANICKNLTFTFDKLYDFENAQVTIGGVQSNNFDEHLMSKLENNVYFIGEIIDNDGLCGGYNLMWAFGSALYLGDFLCK